MPALRRVDLMRTNITAEGLHAIGQPNLRELNVIHTDVNLSELGRPAFANSLRVLLAPHPPAGQGDSLVLDDWPQLEQITCFEYDEYLNEEPVALKLANLPKLTSLELDSLQLFDLELENLPNLSKCVMQSHQWRDRTNAKQLVPSQAWIRNLRIKDVPTLTQFTIFGSHVQSIDIQQTAPMELGISVYNAAQDRITPAPSLGPFQEAQAGVPKPGYLTSADIPAPMRQKWIDDLGNSTGVNHLHLKSVPLDDLKLASLATNRAIRRLSLDQSGLQVSQLLELADMEQLEELSVAGLPIDGRTIEALVKSCPNLRLLVCDRVAVTRLRLENAANLESIFEVQLGANSGAGSQYDGWNRYRAVALDGLRIIDAPKLKDYFVSEVPVKHLYIDGAPRLSGLSFQYPLPANSVVKGVADLKFFAAGGTDCTDAIVSEVLKSQGLQKLTLAYTNLAMETMRPIAGLSDLEYLVLTGSSVDDALVESFSGLSKLRVLRLDQTRVTNRSIPVIGKFTQLEWLDLGELELSPQDASLLLANLTNLKSLNLAGVSLTLEHMAQFSKLTNLQMLDLSRSEFNDEQLISLAKNIPPSLLELRFHSAKLGPAGFSELIKNSPSSLKFSLADTDIAPRLLDWLVSQDRVTLLGNGLGQVGGVDAQGRLVRRTMSMSRGGGYDFSQQSFDVLQGEIDPSFFVSELLSESATGGGDGMPMPAPMPPPTPMNVFQRLGAELYYLQNRNFIPAFGY